MNTAGAQHRAAPPRRPRPARWPRVLLAVLCVLVGIVVGFVAYWKIWGTEPDVSMPSPTSVSAPQDGTPGALGGLTTP